MNKGVISIQEAFKKAEIISIGKATPVGASPASTAAPTKPPQSDVNLKIFEESSSYPLSDLGNGMRFVLHVGKDVIFVPRVGWHVWNGRYWELDKDEVHARKHVQMLPDWIMNEVMVLKLSPRDMGLINSKQAVENEINALEASFDSAKPDPSIKQALEQGYTKNKRIMAVERKLRELRTAHKRFATSSGNSGRLRNALGEASVKLDAAYESLNADPFTVNAGNVILRFNPNASDPSALMTRLEHDRNHRLTKILDANYDPLAEAPIFQKFLETIQPDSLVRGFLQRWFGLSMTGFMGEQKMVFLYGSGSNGKSVLVDTIARILGTYASTAKNETFLGNGRRGGGDATPDLIPLMGARMVRISEPEEGEKLKESFVKELTGGEPLLVRALHSDFVEVNPVFKITMSGNHKPDIRGTDNGIWRRILLVHFGVIIEEKDKDLNLHEKLWAERDGILFWLVQGLWDYLENGLQIPQQVLDSTKEYREESDPVLSFLLESCVITGDANDAILSRDISEAFNMYMRAKGSNPWTVNTITKRIKDKSDNWKHPDDGTRFTRVKDSLMKYVGIKFTPSFKYSFETAERDSKGNLVMKAGS